MQEIKLNRFQELTMSYWLKARISEIPSRDIVDMYNDVCWLKELLENKLQAIEDEHSTECNCWVCETKEGK